jgi:excisionase family DNA binding protein
MTRTPWTKEETQLLEELLGDMPRLLVFEQYRQIAGQRGWVERSDASLDTKVERLGKTFLPVGAWLTTGGVAETLGISSGSVTKWLMRHQDLKRLMIGRRCYIRREDLKKWARKHPEMFGGIERWRLLQLFESEHLVDLLSQYQHRPNVVPVRCVETGQVYASQSAAARALHLDYSSVSLARREGRKSCGRWTFEVAS